MKSKQGGHNENTRNLSLTNSNRGRQSPRYARSREETIMTRPRQSTLLDLVQAITIYTASDAETVATAAYLINSGRVRLCGTFAGARIDLSMLASAAPQSPLPKYVEH